MSHLSILPTLLRDVDLLADALTDLGQVVQRGGAVEGFAGERVPVLLRLDLPAGSLPAGSLPGQPAQAQARSQSSHHAKSLVRRSARQGGGSPRSGFSLGWARQLDGTLALVGDLARIAAASPLQELLGQLSRRYALRQALRDASGSGLAGAQITVGESSPPSALPPLAGTAGPATSLARVMPLAHP